VLQVAPQVGHICYTLPVNSASLTSVHAPRRETFAHLTCGLQQDKY
jgi:hypothetical protein